MMDPDDLLRGTGRTQGQMEAAPHGAVFIWCNDHVDYARRLAHHLGRRDLKITGPNGARQMLLGHRRHPVVIDHAISDQDLARLRPDIELATRGAYAKPEA